MTTLLLLPVVLASVAASDLERPPLDRLSVSRDAEPGRDGPSRDFREDLRDLGRRYGIEIRWEGGPYADEYAWGRRSAQDASEAELEAFAPILIEELSLYPVSFIERGEIERIVLVRELRVSMEGVEQELAGQIFDNREVFLSVSYTAKVDHPDKQRRSFHHLLWHHYDALWGTMWDDPAWEALNPEGFAYGELTRGGQHDRSAESGYLTTELPGFLNRYSTGTLPDDKADLFAYLVVAHGYVETRASEDGVIRSKMEEIMRRLRAFDPGMGGGFWGPVREIQRDVTIFLPPIR